MHVHTLQTFPKTLFRSKAAIDAMARGLPFPVEHNGCRFTVSGVTMSPKRPGATCQVLRTQVLFNA